MSEFIVDFKAEYRVDQDMIQVLIVVAERDGEVNTSLHDAIEQAQVNLLFNRKAIDYIPFDSQSYVVDGDSGLGDFRVFFLHYPRQKELEIEVYVKLLDGRETKVIRVVGVARANRDGSQLHLDNPMLAGRPDPIWKKKMFIDYDRPE